MLFIQMLPLLYGVQRVMLGIMDGMDATVFDVSVASKGKGKLRDEVLSRKCEHISVPFFYRAINPLDFFAFLYLVYICRKKRFDVVHTHSSKPGVLGRVAAKVAGVKKIIHTVHGFPFHKFQPLLVNKLYILLEKLSAKFCDKVVFISESDYETALNLGIVNVSKALLIYNGYEVDNDLIEQRKQKKQQEPRIVVGVVGRFAEQKNILNVVNVAVTVCKKSTELEFVFVGDGKYYEYCKKTVRDSGLEHRIFLKGWQSNVKEIMIDFDVLLQYTKWEGLPLSILEAMSLGVPVIASEIPGNNDLIDGNGVTIPLDQEDDLIKFLLDLSYKRELLDQWSKRSLELVKEKYNKKKFIDKYLELYG